jgi:hypothetical protein
MSGLRYTGLDVHQDTVSVAVLDRDSKLLMQSVFATRAVAILDFRMALMERCTSLPRKAYIQLGSMTF